jgi:hypothetical protein
MKKKRLISVEEGEEGRIIGSRYRRLCKKIGDYVNRI